MTNEIIVPKVVLGLVEVNIIMTVDVIDLFIDELLINDRN